MRRFIIKMIILALVIMGTCYLPGISVDNFGSALIIAVFLTLINTLIKPILKFITFPINFLTFGVFGLFLNLGILYAIAFFIPQYHLENWHNALLASIIIAISYSALKRWKD